MQTFTSHQYPQSRNATMLRQEYAMQFYGGVALVLMVVAILLVAKGNSPGWPLLAIAIAGALLANVAANVRLQRSVAAIIIQPDQFMVLSVADILAQRQPEPFPLNFANPTMSSNTLSLHYHDAILVLHRADWDDFDALWVRLNGFGLQPLITYTITP